MRILVLNYEFPPVGGGGGRASADLCKKLSDRGHEVRVLTARTPGMPHSEMRDGYEIRRVWTGRRSKFRASFMAMAGYVIGGLVPGWRMVRAWHPDVMHVHFAVPTGALGYALHKVGRLPYVLTAHLGDVPGGVPDKTDLWFRVVEPLTPPIWRSASHIVAVSEYTKSLAETRYEVEIEVIPNGIELLDANPVQPVHDPPRLVFAGRFQPQKNLSFLIDALREVRDLSWECALVGDGPQRTALEEQVDRLGLSDRVRFSGWVAPEDAQDRLAESDLLVMPSLSEGLPVVSVQALANGVAVAASAAGGLAEVVEDGVNGVCCPVGDFNCYVKGLRYCLEDPDRLTEMKRASRERAARYDLRRVADEYETIFGEMLSG